MRRSWPVIAALGLGLPVLAVFATGCHEREVAYYPEREVYVEPGYSYYPYYPYGYYGYDGYGYRHYRHEREREHAFRHEREHRERHG